MALAALAFAGCRLPQSGGRRPRWSSRTFAGCVGRHRDHRLVPVRARLCARPACAVGIASSVHVGASPAWRCSRSQRARCAFLMLAIVLGWPSRSAAAARCRAPGCRSPLVALAGLGRGARCGGCFRTEAAIPSMSGTIVAGSIFCLLGLSLTWRVESARVLRFFFAVYLRRHGRGVPRAVGARRQHRAAALLSQSRWQLSCSPSATGGRCRSRSARCCSRVSWNISALATNYVPSQVRRHGRRRRPGRGAIAYLEEARRAAIHRVEAVDTVGHWPAFYLAKANIPLARGWFRQDDFPRTRPYTETRDGPGWNRTTARSFEGCRSIR